MYTYTNESVPVQHFNIKRVFLITLISSLSLSALVAISVFLIGKFGEIEIRLLLTTLIIGGYSLTGLCSAVLYDKGKYPIFALLGIIIAVLGFFITIGAIWEIVNLGDIWKEVFTCMILSFSIAHSSLLLLTKSESGLINSILTITLIFIALVSLMLINLVIDGANDTGFYYRLLGVFAVLDVLGTIVISILRRIKS